MQNERNSIWIANWFNNIIWIYLVRNLVLKIKLMYKLQLEYHANIKNLLHGLFHQDQHKWADTQFWHPSPVVEKTPATF